MVSKPKKGQQKTGRTGRPPILDPAAKRDVPIHVLTTKSEKDELQRAAEDADMSVSHWIRSVALKRARALAAKKAEQEAHG